MNQFLSSINKSKKRLALPIAMYPGIHLTGASVKDIVTNVSCQFEAQMALHERYNTSVVMTGMDLSVESEAFGSSVQFSDNEIPTIIGRLIRDHDSVHTLSIPSPGDKRTQIYLDVAARLNKLPGNPVVLGGMIGPFTLAGRLFGIRELLELTLVDADAVHSILAITVSFLTAYGLAFKEIGARGIIIAEPAAGLLSPKSLAIFSSNYIREINEKLCDDTFTLILHNCGARKNHIDAMLKSGCDFFHFGAPMDIHQVLEIINNDIIIAGNLDPSAIFLEGSPIDIYKQTSNLLTRTSSFNNFVISSGCDLPPDVPIEKVDAFYDAVKDYNKIEIDLNVSGNN